MKNYKPKNLNNSAKEVRTGNCRLSYPHLFEKYGDQNPKYQAVLIIPKKDRETYRLLREAVDAATEDGKQKLWGGVVPKKFEDPIRDGDDPDVEDPNYADCWYISPKTTTKPRIIDLDTDEILDQEEIYAGCYVRAAVKAYPYDNKLKGVGFALNLVQKIGDGERIGGSHVSDDDFADDGDDDDLGL